MITHVLPRDVLLAQRLEDRDCTGSSSHVVKPPRGLEVILEHSTGRAGGRKLTVRVGWAGVFRELD